MPLGFSFLGLGIGWIALHIGVADPISRVRKRPEASPQLLHLEAVGCYAVSFVGGLVASAPSVVSAATLGANGALDYGVVGTGVIVATVTSRLSNLPILARYSGYPNRNRGIQRIVVATVVLGVLAIVRQA
jgi:hypothetical protein